MATISTLLCLLGTCLPQDSAARATRTPATGTVGPITNTSVSEPTPGGAIHLAGLLPPDTVAAIALNPIAPHRTELAATGVPRLVARQLGATAERFFAQILAQRSDAGAAERLASAWQHGAVLSFHGFANDQPRWLFAADLGLASNELESTLDALRAALVRDGGRIERGTHGTAVVHTIAVPDSATVVAQSRHGHWLFIGSPADEVRAAIDRAADPARPSLASATRYRTYSTQVARDLATAHGPLAAFYCDVQAAVSATLSQVPTAQRGKVESWLHRLDVDSLTSAGIAMAPVQGSVRESITLGTVGTFGGLLAALFPPTSSFDPSLSQVVPDDVSSFSLTSIDFDGLFREIVALVAFAEPGFERTVETTLAQMRDRTGIDLQSDLLDNLGSRLVSLQWAPTTDSGTGDGALVVELIDDSGIRSVVEKLGLFAPRPAGSWVFYEARAGSLPFAPCLAIGRGKLVASSTRQRAEALVAHLASPTPNPRVAALIGAAPKGATTIGALDPRAWIPPATFATSAPIPEPLRLGLAAFGAEAGPLTYCVTATREGIAFHSTSTTGGFTGLLATAFSGATATALDGMSRDIAAATPTATGQKDPAVAVLDEFAAAIARQRDAGQTFQSIQALVDGGFLPAGKAGRPDRDGTHRIGDRLLAVLPLPETGRFAVVSWPADSQRGDVFARTDSGPAMRNDLISRSTGAKRITLRDLFEAEQPGKWQAGWRSVSGSTPRTASTAAPTSSPGDREAFEEVVRLETANDTNAVPALIGFLGHTHAKVVARAAFALGTRKSAAAIERLADVATTHPDPEARRHAMFALVRIRDPRSVDTALHALTSDDATLRALAARHLGELRSRAGRDALLGAISTYPATESSAEESTARVQSLLALADIGDAEVLVPAATAVTADLDAEGQALAFLFQSLSSRLTREREVTTLMAVLDHASTPLRRFAVQRLGELGDKNSVTALEQRLASETPAIVPLVEEALDRIRGDRAATGNAGWFERTKASASAAVRRAKAKWSSLDSTERGYLLLGVALALGVLFAGFSIARRRARRKHGEDWASMVAPSAGFADAADAEFGEAEGEPGYESEFDDSEAGYDEATEEFAAQSAQPEDYAVQGWPRESR